MRHEVFLPALFLDIFLNAETFIMTFKDGLTKDYDLDSFYPLLGAKQEQQQKYGENIFGGLCLNTISS